MKAQDLKNSVLQLAIQGKLVEQNPNDEPASILSEKIKSEKEQLIKENKLKKEKLLPEISEEEKTFEIPESWEWVRLGDICDIINGFTPSRSNKLFWENGDIPWFTIEDIREQGRFIKKTKQNITKEALGKSTNRILPSNTVLLCCTASVGEYAYTEISLTTNQQFNGLVIRDEYKQFISSLYLFEFVKTLKSRLYDKAGTTTFSFLSVGKLREFIMPVPPVEEQKRIVAKIEEVLEKIEEYDKAEKELSELENLFPQDMKKSILQYAIQGKLVEQNLNDEPASVLLEKIKAEKEQLIKEKKIKKEKSLPKITEEEKPFEIPDTWEWIRLKDVGYNLGQKKPNKKFSYIDVGSINKELGILGNDINVLEPEEAPSRARKKVDKGTVIYSTVRPYLLNIAIIDRDFEFEPIVSTAFAIIHPFESINNKYIYYYLKSNTFIKYVESQMVGVAYPAINDEKFFKGVIPLPPLEEQKRIVDKIEKLMNYIDRLQDKINNENAISKIVQAKSIEVEDSKELINS